MLSQMRRGANSWLIVLMFGAIIFVFAINFGPWAGNVGGGTPYAADVNGRVITIAQFQSAYAMQFRTMQNYRPEFTHEQAEAEGLRQLVLDQLVTKELLAQLAEKHGLSISDEELAKFIRDHMFGKDKAFDKEAYKQAIYSNFHTTENQFEAQIRRELLADRASELLGTGAYASDFEQDKDMTRSSLLMTRRREFLQNYIALLKKDASIKYNSQIMGQS